MDKRLERILPRVQKPARYTGGEFTYSSKEQLIDFCVTHMASESWPAEQVRAHMEAVVPELKHWKK